MSAYERQRSEMLQLINLPDVVFEKILSNLTYDEIARSRIVCKHFDQTCQRLLNRGFNLVEKYHEQCTRAVISQLPRRESERRTHPLARHCETLAAIENRISLLNLTFIKFINLNLCCFIPGKVIDEIFRVLRFVRNSKAPLMGYEILKELRDISCMAMEHFEEKILPDLEHRISTVTVGNVGSYTLSGSGLITSHRTTNPSYATPSHNLRSEKLNQIFKNIYSRTKKNKLYVLSVKEQIGKMKLMMKRQGLQIRLQSLRLREQAKKIHDQDTKLAEMRKHQEEWEQKMGDSTAELNLPRKETQKSDAIEGCKRKRIDIINTRESNPVREKELPFKKRKLIIERKSSSDAKDMKFLAAPNSE